MRATVFLFVIGLVVVGCKDPGAEVAPATVESPVEPKAQPTSGDACAGVVPAPKRNV